MEDDAGFAELVAEFLPQTGDDLTVTTVTDPEDGLARFRETPAAYDCIVSDYDMPKMEGLEVLKTIRKEWPDMPFILFTGKGNEEIAARAISAGVTDYLQKSAGSDTYEMLAHRIRNAVERHQAQKEAARTRRFLEKVVE
ncbi:MAG: response regulator [Salinirussus sp.]